MTDRYLKPLPRLEGLTGQWYEFAKKHELRFQRCTGCGTWRHVPREFCAGCGLPDFEWALSSGLGQVFTWTTTYRPLHPAFAEDVPYAGVVVELDEGPRVITAISDVAPDELAMGLRVTAWFDDVTDDITLVKFRRAGT